MAEDARQRAQQLALAQRVKRAARAPKRTPETA
jgi:hypothetical protein